MMAIRGGKFKSLRSKTFDLQGHFSSTLQNDPEDSMCFAHILSLPLPIFMKNQKKEGSQLTLSYIDDDRHRLSEMNVVVLVRTG